MERHQWISSGRAPYLQKGWLLLPVAGRGGGTSYGHMVTMARSKNIWGPYEPCPHNPVLSNRYNYDARIHGTGHADLFEAHGGSWWAVHLAFRTPPRY